MEHKYEQVKCMIIGSGPAGYTAAIYAARADLKPVLYTGLTTGGQLTQTTDVENYPGYPDGIMGTDMMENFRKQAVRFGTDIRNGIITEIDFSTIPYKVQIPVILTTSFQFKVTTQFRFKVTTLFRSKLTTPFFLQKLLFFHAFFCC